LSIQKPKRAARFSFLAYHRICTAN